MSPTGKVDNPGNDKSLPEYVVGQGVTGNWI